MGDIHDLSGLRRTADQLTQMQARLNKSGGGGTSGGMEERVARLEKSVEKISDQLLSIQVDMATLKENVRHLPTKPWMFTTLASMLGIMVTLLTFIMAALVRFLPHAS